MPRPQRPIVRDSPSHAPAADPTPVTMNNRFLVPAAVLALAATAAAQRPMSLSSAPVYGASTDIITGYPLSATGSIYVLLWSQPFPGAFAPSIPGFTVNGLARVDLGNFTDTSLGVYGGSGSESINISIPLDPSFVGLALDVQTVDLDAANLALNFADNDLNIVVGCGIGEVNIAEATSAAFLTNDNNASFIDNGNIGAPTSQGLPAYAYAFTRHRGDEGFVEGYGGTFSSTSHNSDIDSISNRRVGRRLVNAVYQVIACPNGYDLSIVRSTANAREFSMLSYERATGTARIVPGTTFVDTATAATTIQGIQFYPAVSRDGTWCTIILKDNTTPTPAVTDRVLAFRTDGLSPAIDITPVGPTAWFDATPFYTNDFLLIAGNGGWHWTSATAPTTLLPLAVPSTTATNAPNIWIFPFSWRVSPDGSTAYFPAGSLAAASRGEMDMVQVTNNAGTPVAVNFSQFPVATSLAEFGYAALSPSTANNSSTGIKASVSPDGSKIAVLAATTTTTVFPGLYVMDGTANPTLRTVAGAAFYSEVAFINNTTVIFFAGASSTAQSMYSLDVPTGTITQIGAATDHRTRGSFWSLNKNWWYFIRSNSASTLNNIVGVNCATGAVYDVTGSEFGGGGSVGTIRTGSFNTTADPWFALEMQIRRSPVGDYAYFTARRETGIAATYEDANVFRWDIENGGTATMLTNNVGTGAGATTVRSIESLMIAQDGNHIAWGQRLGTAATASEDVFHMDLTTNVITQASVTLPTGQTITDGSIRFTCDNGGTPTGLCWSRGTGSVTVPTANAVVEWAALGSSTPVVISAPAAGTRLYQVLGTNL